MSGRRPPQHTHPRDVTIEAVLTALADPVRLSIVRCVAQAKDWELPCGSLDVGVGKATLSHHFSVLRETGLLEQRDEGARRTIRLRREEFDEHFPGLLDLVVPSARVVPIAGIEPSAERGRMNRTGGSHSVT